MSDILQQLTDQRIHGFNASMEVREAAAKEIAALRSDIERHMHTAATLATENEELRRCREDAERYRWLRENINIGSSASNLDRWSIDLPDPCKEIDVSSFFDAAIDEARKESK